MSEKNFQTCYVHILERVEDSDGNLYNASIVSAAFNLSGYNNYACYLQGDASPTMLREANQRATHVECVQIVFLENSYDLR